VRGALSAGYRVGTVNIGITPLHEWPSESRDTDHEPRYATSVVHDNVAHAKDRPQNYALGPQYSWKRRAMRRTVGCWYRELSELPEEFRPSFDLVDEVWVAFCVRRASSAYRQAGHHCAARCRNR